MIERIEIAAQVSIARGCGFAGIGIVTTMVGLAGDLFAVMKAGGLLCLLTSAVLQLKAWHAPRRPYNATELWLMLKPNERPAASIAQQVIGSVLREVYIRFAVRAAVIAAFLLAWAVVVGLLGTRGSIY